MNKYAILRTEKLKSAASVWRSLKHAFREQPTENADPERADNNAHLGASSAREAMEKVRARLPEKRRKDAVLAIEYLITASPEAMAKMAPQERTAYFNDALKWLKQRHGGANVVYSGVPRHAKTQHIYNNIKPLNKTIERLNARRWRGGAKALSEMQTDFAANVGARHGLDGVVSENGQQSTVSKPALPLSCSHIATTIEPLKPSREMTMSTADTYVRARIDTSTKERAADALEAMGLSISDAIRLLMLRIADERRMPFDVKAPNATTRKAIAELEAGKGKRFASVDDLMADLHADD